MRRRAFFEPLESRQLLAAVVVGGLATDDVITVEDDAGGVKVTVNGTPTTYTSVDSVTINAGDGNDTISLVSLPAGGGSSSTVIDSDGTTANDDFSTAQDLELPSVGWCLSFDANIGNEVANISTTYAHVTVVESGDAAESADVYRFVIPAGGATAIFDIDETTNGFDSYLEILDSSGNSTPVVNDDFNTSYGAGGSEFSYLFDDDNDSNTPGLSYSLDSFISSGFAAGTYYVKVTSALGGGVPANASYKLQVAILNHPLATGTPPNVIVNGENGLDTLNVAASLTPGELYLSGTPYSGGFGDGEITYTSIENVNGGAPFVLEVELAAIAAADGNADTTFVRPDATGTQLLVDINGTPYFGGNIANISQIEVTGSSDVDIVIVQNTTLDALVHGGDGADQITTSAGDDQIYGDGGDDVISTDGGDDYVSGGIGNDTIISNGGMDRLYGNAGDDAIFGGNGSDLVSGGDGNDELSGQNGADVLIGGDGADVLWGFNDRDLLFASGATHANYAGTGDSTSFSDIDNQVMLALLVAWSLDGSMNGFVSSGDDGDFDELRGGRGEDSFVEDGSGQIFDTQP